MPGVWKKTMQYLGLVEDDELEDLEEGLDQRVVRQETSPVRRYSRSTDVDVVEPPPAIVRTMPSTKPPRAAIHRAEPMRFNEAREFGERFRDGVPVIMNLQGARTPSRVAWWTSRRGSSSGWTARSSVWLSACTC
jgi:cell division inhibitor SepF